MRTANQPQARDKRGSALIEVTLLAPWVLFLFVGMVDLGFFCYSLINIENAARIGAEYTSKSSLMAGSVAGQSGACTRILAELSSLPNVRNLANCSAAPLVVTANAITGVDGGAATSVTVTYQSAQLIPIPGLLMGKLYVARNVQMRVQP